MTVSAPSGGGGKQPGRRTTSPQSSGIREEEGKPVHDENYQTNIPGLFVAGDIPQESGGSIALGLNHGYAIAHYIMNNGS